MINRRKKALKIERIGIIVAPCGLLLCSIYIYYMSLIGKIWDYQFPTSQVIMSLPVSFGMWSLSALVDPKYRNIYEFIGCMIFGCIAMTATFLMFGKLTHE